MSRKIKMYGKDYIPNVTSFEIIPEDLIAKNSSMMGKIKTKKAKTPYAMYCDRERSKVVTQFPSLKPFEVRRELGKRWRELKAAKSKK